MSEKVSLCLRLTVCSFIRRIKPAHAELGILHFSIALASQNRPCLISDGTGEGSGTSEIFSRMSLQLSGSKMGSSLYFLILRTQLKKLESLFSRSCRTPLVSSSQIKMNILGLFSQLTIPVRSVWCRYLKMERASELSPQTWKPDWTLNWILRTDLGRYPWQTRFLSSLASELFAWKRTEFSPHRRGTEKTEDSNPLALNSLEWDRSTEDTGRLQRLFVDGTKILVSDSGIKSLSAKERMGITDPPSS